MTATEHHYLDEFSVGEKFTTGEHTLTREECLAFARSYDPQPFHLDEEAAKTTLFKRLAASAWLTMGVAMRLIVQSGFLHESGIIGAGTDELRFLAPVYPGDTLHVESEIIEIIPAPAGKRFGRLRVFNRVLNQDGTCVISFIPNLTVPVRPPTSHERSSGRPWDASYHDGPAPWDIGKPQPAIARVVSEGGFAGAVLDAGCGTGENTLLVASLGLPTLGVDVAQTALTTARAKAKERKIDAEFAAADAFELERLGRTFRTVLDCGLFHTFDGEERPRYVASLASVTERAGTLYLLCFSDLGHDVGPHPVSQKELRAAFNAGTGWNILTIEPERVMTRFHGEHGAPAWLATVKRI